MINCKFPKKTLYMFDTFESFDKKEFEKEVSLKRVPDSFYETFKQTDENYVLSIMPYPDKCKICKGFFPDTTRDLKETKFAFVSIDVDFEQSIYEGLKFFYPRLNDGGMIFVHDYNNRYLEGVKVAVHRYENEIGIKLKKVPLADEGGTVIVVKWNEWVSAHMGKILWSAGDYYLENVMLIYSKSLIASGGVNETLKENAGRYEHVYVFDLGTNK